MLNEVMNGITVALPFVVGVGGVGVLASGYVKASPDTALIISGLRKKPKVLIGKAGIKVPFFERMDKLSLKLIPLDIKTGDAVPTADCINIYVDSAVNVKVGSTSEMVEIAAQNFLNKSTEEIGDIVTEVLEGNIREIICTMKLRELIGDRKTFVEKVSENVIPDLKKMGLELVSFNVQRFSDENHVINDLGIDNISQIKKDAAIAKANADKEVEIAKAKASKEANDARVQSESEIAIKQNELDIKKAELKKESDIKKAEADAAYTIQEEEQRKTVEITTANANLAKQEKELELKEREVAIQEKTLEASIKKKAEADKYAAQPLSFWTEQDILEYIKKYNLPYAPVYGEIIQDNKGKWQTTKCNRTGCVFCMYGCHLEKEPNRFQSLKITHPKLWQYCMKPMSEGGLGLKEVLEFIGVKIE